MAGDIARPCLSPIAIIITRSEDLIPSCLHSPSSPLPPSSPSPRVGISRGDQLLFFHTPVNTQQRGRAARITGHGSNVSYADFIILAIRSIPARCGCWSWCPHYRAARRCYHEAAVGRGPTGARNGVLLSSPAAECRSRVRQPVLYCCIRRPRHMDANLHAAILFFSVMKCLAI